MTYPVYSAFFDQLLPQQYFDDALMGVLALNEALATVGRDESLVLPLVARPRSPRFRCTTLWLLNHVRIILLLEVVIYNETAFRV